jgi:hypothetical protein
VVGRWRSPHARKHRAATASLAVMSLSANTAPVLYQVHRCRCIARSVADETHAAQLAIGMCASVSRFSGASPLCQLDGSASAVGATCKTDAARSVHVRRRHQRLPGAHVSGRAPLSAPRALRIRSPPLPPARAGSLSCCTTCLRSRCTPGGSSSATTRSSRARWRCVSAALRSRTHRCGATCARHADMGDRVRAGAQHHAGCSGARVAGACADAGCAFTRGAQSNVGVQRLYPPPICWQVDTGSPVFWWATDASLRVGCGVVLTPPPLGTQGYHLPVRHHQRLRHAGLPVRAGPRRGHGAPARPTAPCHLTRHCRRGARASRATFASTHASSSLASLWFARCLRAAPPRAARRAPPRSVRPSARSRSGTWAAPSSHASPGGRLRWPVAAGGPRRQHRRHLPPGVASARGGGAALHRRLRGLNPLSSTRS